MTTELLLAEHDAEVSATTVTSEVIEIENEPASSLLEEPADESGDYWLIAGGKVISAKGLCRKAAERDARALVENGMGTVHMLMHNITYTAIRRVETSYTSPALL